MVTLTESSYHDRVHGAWLGKLIGVSLGAPADGEKQSRDLDLSALDALSRSPIGPTTSFDFEQVWLRALQSEGPRVTSNDLAAAWCKHLTYGDGELAYAQANLRRDLHPPVSGAFDNPFQNGIAGLARADLWGLISPGDPRQAAQYARQDAMIDHAGSGLEAACVVAAMVSAAFVEFEPPRLLEIGLGLIPAESRVARAVRDVMRWHGELAQWSRTREMLLRAHGSEDVGDAVVAAGLIAIALMHERSDFGRALVTAANCGWSSEATCGAVGAILGTAAGAAAIPARWRDAVADDIRPGWGLVGLGASQPVAAVAEQTVEIGRLVIKSELAGRVQLAEDPPETAPTLVAIDASGFVRQLAMGSYITTFRRGALEVDVDYDARPTIGYNLPRRLTIGLANAGSRSLDLRTRISAPDGFVVTTNSDRITLPEGGSVAFTAGISAPDEYARIGGANSCTLFISLEEMAEVTVPISLVGESLWYAAGPYGDFDEAHAPEQQGILSGETALGGEGWQRLSAAEPATNILAGFDGEPGTYYLATDYQLARARPGRLRVGCNDGAKVWLNGRETYSQHEHRPVSPTSADEFDVELWEGWNRLVIKMAQCSPRRFLSLVLKDLDQRILVEAVNTVPRH